ncbi:VOC family protein [Chitinophagaceae bacterium LB-8]|uniref:VOC family protein n=1 Tax=Paraflavisolibacter caeni TaxID=2982496 RepID=A0A9X3B9H6_9BACT|nr:VOC family protein [Paraflavisolibacter caeni]MCU7551990.1 VOC family protein [Paraflavisolibacter caeni]
MNISRIKETCIYVTDLHRTKAFYTDLLGLPLISLVENRHVFFRAGESVLLCFIAAQTLQEKELPPHGASGCIHFAFEVARDEYPIALKKLKESGIQILHEHEWKGGLRSFYFHDPDQNLLEVIEEGLWEG